DRGGAVHSLQTLQVGGITGAVQVLFAGDVVDEFSENFLTARHWPRSHGLRGTEARELKPALDGLAIAQASPLVRFPYPGHAWGHAIRTISRNPRFYWRARRDSNP